ncbi:MAG: pyridoxine 5'-phosphate synthase [Phycisphaerales bacterium]|nr:MAG: pyridoxine 5'-phosphate synthase [Planctomycetota bacterium]
MIELGVNVDHVATIRQARRTWEPDPVWAAVEAQLGGADAVTVHLREDRRHIQDQDVERMRGVVQVRLNLEMAATAQMVAIALGTAPAMVTLVPEGRQEITTEGGLDVAGRRTDLAEVVRELRGAGIRTSAFIDAEPGQVEAAAACGFDACEVHTGPYANRYHEHGRADRHPEVRAEIERVGKAGAMILEAGMQFNAGHALTYYNVQPIAALTGLRELHIGHSIVARAIFTGLRQAVADMKTLMREVA